MIKSFACRDTAALFAGKRVRAFEPFRKQAERKLIMLEAAVRVDDLRSPPGNRLERLSGDRKGFYSIRINDQWRICFSWGSDGPENVEIVDYH